MQLNYYYLMKIVMAANNTDIKEMMTMNNKRCETSRPHSAAIDS